MTTYDVLSKYSTGVALRIAGLVMVALLLRLVAVPLAVAALLTGRLVACVDSAVMPAPRPPSPPRWAAANTRTRTYATV
jgi:hypothetical protein